MVNIEEFVKELHIYARKQHEEMKSSGHKFDKKQLRWNDIVRVGVEYMQLGFIADPQTGLAGVREALMCCSPDFPEYYIKGGSCLSVSQPWFLSVVGNLNGAVNV